MLLYRSYDVQLFGFTPRGNPMGREQAVGLALRVRARGRWRNLAVRVYWPRHDLRLVPNRPPIALEVSTWLSGKGHRNRLTVKTFLRIKFGLGGRMPNVNHKVLRERRGKRNRLMRNRVANRLPGE